MNELALLPALERFLESVSVTHKWRRLAPLEKRVTREIAKLFRKQGKAAIKALATRRHKFTEGRGLREALTLSDGEEIVDEAATVTREEFVDVIQEATEEALELGWQDGGEEAGYTIAFDLGHPRAVAYIEEHGYGLISQIDATTRGNIATVINNGIDEGWSYNRMAREITHLYSRMAVGRPQQHIESRAHLIAVTEIGNAYEAGTAMVIRDLQAAGEPMEKKWLTVGDNRVSAGCRANAAEGWIPEPQAFSSGHQHPLRFPGCRCTTQYQRVR